MTTCIVVILKDVVILQSIFTVCAIAFAPVIVSLAGGEFHQIAIYRVGALGAFIQSVFLFITIILFYFDLRRVGLCLQVLFLACNATFTYISLGLGFSFYGYGYFLASIISCLAALGVLAGVLRRLPYITFISNNPSVC